VLRHGVSGGERENRAKALTAGKHAVAHRLAHDRGTRRRFGQIAIERFIDARARRLDERSERSDSSHASVAFRLVTGGQRRRRRLEVAALAQDLDAAFGFLEAGVAETGKLYAALVQQQRLFERQVAFFELLDDRFEFGDGGFEVLYRSVGHLPGLGMRLRWLFGG